MLPAHLAQRGGHGRDLLQQQPCVVGGLGGAGHVAPRRGADAVELEEVLVTASCRGGKEWERWPEGSKGQQPAVAGEMGSVRPGCQ